MDTFKGMIVDINNVIWHDYALYFVLAVGVLFTIWSGFGQYRALTHGGSVVRGRYDDKNDPGAINHFQALSTALSATVGLGNIAGVAIAISVGGPGAMFWMWVVGLVGMCLKMTEVTQSMLFRDTSDPDNPHGGPMWVCKRGFQKLNPKLSSFGAVLGGIFCVTLIISSVTGGNMFQAWSVADLSYSYFGIPQWVTGVILAVAVGLVIVGGIRRIGDVAGRIVPFMCLIYVIAALAVVILNITEVPALFLLIFTEAFSPTDGVGAFVGGAAGYGFLVGMQRALFSNEAGQGSAPIAHSAVKTDEPVREGIVAGLEPFIDTLCVCTLTGLVVLLSNTWNRDADLAFVDVPQVSPVVAGAAQAQVQTASGEREWQIEAASVVIADEDAAEGQMREGAIVFAIVEGGMNADTGSQRHRINGVLVGSDGVGWTAAFDRFALPAAVVPELAVNGAYLRFEGATLTAKSFDRVLPGFGFLIVPLTAWLFAFSTIISWSYYGEQGAVYLFGERAAMIYRVVYCLLTAITVQLVSTTDQLTDFTNFGTGIMLWVNIPIMLIFGHIAMRAYREYFARLDSGQMEASAQVPSWRSVISGKDVE